MRLKGKTALIAGASRNIGREIAVTFARAGAGLDDEDRWERSAAADTFRGKRG